MWNSGSSEIFSCSLDGFICQIDVKASKLMSKFHANYNDTSSGKAKSASRKSLGRGREPLHSICLHPSEKSVIVGSLSKIIWIDLDTKAPLKMFEGGHVGIISSLAILQVCKQSYILSTGDSSDDYTITAWKLSLEDVTDNGKREKAKKQILNQSSDSIVAKFSLNENVRSIFLPETSSSKLANPASSVQESEQIFGAITKSGTLHYFKHEWNSTKKKKPIKPKSSLQVCSAFSAP